MLPAAMLCGCSKPGIERAVVTGTVTFDGQPVTQGTIRFTPVGQTETPPWGAEIIDGRYSCHGRGGVPVGTHKVEIEGYSDASPPAPLEPLGPGITRDERRRGRQFLPAKYNSETELRITIEPGSQKIQKDFDLTP